MRERMAVDGPSGGGGGGAGPGGEKAEAPSEDSIRVVCRFRPLNDTEEKTGSKFIVKFPQNSDDQCVTLGVRLKSDVLKKELYKIHSSENAKFGCQTPPKRPHLVKIATLSIFMSGFLLTSGATKTYN